MRGELWDRLIGLRCELQCLAAHQWRGADRRLGRAAAGAVINKLERQVIIFRVRFALRWLKPRYLWNQSWYWRVKNGALLRFKWQRFKCRAIQDHRTLIALHRGRCGGARRSGSGLKNNK